jgi:hypothetical protein
MSNFTDVQRERLADALGRIAYTARKLRARTDQATELTAPYLLSLTNDVEKRLREMTHELERRPT